MTLQLQGFKNPSKATEDSSIELVVTVPPGEARKPNQWLMLDVAKERLLAIERGIERRYLKPPFCKA